MQRLITQKLQKHRQKNSRRGQALVEYVLLVAFVTLIFGSIFSIIRRGVYFFWICELYPRVASVGSCAEASDCFEQLKAGQSANFVPPACGD